MFLINTLVLILSLAGGGLIVYLCLRPQLNEKIEYNNSIYEQNKQIKEENEFLILEYNRLLEDRSSLNHELSVLKIQIDEKSNQITSLENQSKQAADLFYKENMALAEERFDRSLEEKSKEYQKTIEAFEKQLVEIQNEGAAQIEETLQEKRQELAQLLEVLAETNSEVAAAVEAAKRAEEMKTSADFYRIQLSETDIKEIEMLRSIAPYLRDKEPLNKVIWKVYYEKPTTDLIGRVIGSGVHTGIYKITNIENQMCYIGQAVKLADEKLFPITVGGLLY